MLGATPTDRSPMASAKPSDALRQMITGCLVTQLVYVVAKIGVADRLATGPSTAGDLAAATGVHPQALYRVLRALASLGVFAEDDRGRFSLTEAAAALRSDAPDSLQAFAMLWGEVLWPSCGALLHSVRTGQPAFEHLHGMGVFEYLPQHPQAAEIFDRAMTNLTRRSAKPVVAAYDFSSVNTVVDVGGGQGTLLAAVLRANPRLKGVLYDRPDVLATARRTLAGEGVLERCELVRGDFFSSVPRGGDAYLLKDVLHDWDDRRAVAILTTCAR
jgi:O-methyltransferase domain/Dimerisation domain